ncbi:MAG: carbonic anhydrase [Patescibacteria group bacterium]
MTGQKVLYQTPFHHKDVHKCEAVVLCCIDFRFWRETMNFVESYFKIKSYDFPKLPGSAKAIIESKGEDLASSCVEVPCNLHKVDKIILVNHEDCGAYGGSKPFQGDKEAEQEFHEKELARAFRVIKSQHPDKEIHTIYARLNRQNTEIEFVKVEAEKISLEEDDRKISQAA